MNEPKEITLIEPDKKKKRSYVDIVPVLLIFAGTVVSIIGNNIDSNTGFLMNVWGLRTVSFGILVLLGLKLIEATKPDNKINKMSIFVGYVPILVFVLFYSSYISTDEIRKRILKTKTIPIIKMLSQMITFFLLVTILLLLVPKILFMVMPKTYARKKCLFEGLPYALFTTLLTVLMGGTLGVYFLQLKARPVDN